MYRLTPEVEQSLKHPHGELLKGNQPCVFDPVYRELQNTECVITVGDRTSLNLIGTGVLPCLCVIDEKTKRDHMVPGLKEMLLDLDYEVVSVQNSPATISDDLWSAMSKYIKGGEKVAIIVEGEEDLAAIPAVLLAPEGAVVCYGQPDEGVVVIRVTEDIKEKAKSLLDKMEVVEE